MLELAEAQEIVLGRVDRLPDSSTVVTDLLDTVGRVLAEDVTADIDLPIFRRSTMDGFAVRSDDAREAGVELRIVGESAAGRPFAGAVGRGAAVRIFTGAAVPDETDAVIMVERTEVEGERVRLLTPMVAGQNVADRGEDMRAGEVALAAGTPIGTCHIGLLASLGSTRVKTLRRPTVAVLSTGSELVEPDQLPAAGMIRESNGRAMAALIRQAGGEPVQLGLVVDDPGQIRARAEQGLKSDLFLLSGGSSVGDYDFTPQVLAELGVETHFDRVAIKPGKPTLFGTTADCVVFGLPGNPISALVAFHLLVRPALLRRAGCPDSRTLRFPVRLESPVRRNPARQLCLPARLSIDAQGFAARFLGWHGSGDLTCLNDADALILVPKGDGETRPGELVLAAPLDSGRLGDLAFSAA